MKQIVLPYDLLPWQAEVRFDPHRFKVICAGRRSGKTTLGVDFLLNGAATTPNSLWWFVGPTYNGARDAAWGILKHFAEPFIRAGLVARIVESDLKVQFVHGGTVQLKGGDSPDSLRGAKLNALVLDEYAIMTADVWDAVLQPMLGDLGGPAYIISTPRGYNHFHHLFSMELDAEKGKDWRSWRIKTSEAGTLPPEEIERARRDSDPRVFRQEYEASFETFGGQVYPDFDRKHHVTASPIAFNPAFEYACGMDFGWSAPTAVLFINISPDETVYVFDELQRRETPIQETGLKIASLVPQHRPGLIGCDPAGDAKHESLGRSSVAELRTIFGHDTVRYVRHYPGSVADGINQIRKWIRNGKLVISPKCMGLIQALEMYRYPDPKNDVQSELPLKDGISDHLCDALRYFFAVRFPYRKATWGAL